LSHLLMLSAPQIKIKQFKGKAGIQKRLIPRGLIVEEKAIIVFDKIFQDNQNYTVFTLLIFEESFKIIFYKIKGLKNTILSAEGSQLRNREGVLSKMKKRSVVIVMLVIAAGSFMAGVWVNQTSHRSKPGERKILYYVDPMNPSYRSDKPGIAPGCGMPLEPVYADQKGVATGGADLPKSLPPGTIRISNEKQQLIGVKVITVEKVPWTHTARVLGRVTPDENRIYRINAAINGSVEEVQPFTTGSLVKRDELLATIYSQEYRATVQSYQNLMKARKPGS
jgi:hypothetical protein